MESGKRTRWSGKTGGRPWMQCVLIAWFRYANMRISYFMMGCIVPFYMLFSRKGYLSMYRFFRERLVYSPLKAFGYVYLNHYTFGQVILDRFAAYAGKTFRFEIDGNEYFEHLVNNETGFIQLSSHVGNYELAGYSLVTRKKRFHALVFPGETETVMKNRNRLFALHNIGMVPVKADLSHVFLINNALSYGDIVSMPGDRIFGSRKSVSCPFFGADARFPLGPFAMVARREVPALAVFVMKETISRYRILVRQVEIPPSVAVNLSRKEKEKALARVFAGELECVVRRYPTQWFNYYDFWNQEE